MVRRRRELQNLCWPTHVSAPLERPERPGVSQSQRALCGRCQVGGDVKDEGLCRRAAEAYRSSHVLAEPSGR